MEERGKRRELKRKALGRDLKVLQRQISGNA